MSYPRRSAERRRRVLVSTRQAEFDGSSASARRYAQRMREARRPTAAYGFRVHRRLRGRWFALVPVSRGALTAVIGGLLLLAAMLAAGHYAAVSLPPIASNPDLARPLRLDRPDSLGRWVTCLMTATTAGVCLLIYQLRRYRTDDFEGHYRIWRPVLLVMAFASLNELAGLITWSGAVVDMIAGRRVAMRGEDWLRIVFTIGGAVLALRLFAELRRCRGAVAAMAIAWGFLALPAASHWHLFELNSRGRWLLVTVAPTFAHTFFLITFGVYLRSLYREVRQIEEQPPRPLLTDLLHRLRAATRPGGSESPAADAASRVASTSETSTAETSTAAERRRARRASQPKKTGTNASGGRSTRDSENESVGASGERPKRPWSRFSLGILPKRRRSADDESPNRRTAEADDGSNETTGPDEGDDPNQAEPKRRRFAFPWPRRRGPTGQAANDTDEAAEEGSETSRRDDRADRSRRAGSPANRHGDESGGDDSDENDSYGHRSDRHESDGDESDGDDGIDWANLSKAERRRLRKQMKRQGRAA